MESSPRNRWGPNPEIGGLPNPFTVQPPRKEAVGGAGGIVAQRPEFD